MLWLPGKLKVEAAVDANHAHTCLHMCLHRIAQTSSRLTMLWLPGELTVEAALDDDRDVSFTIEETVTEEEFAMHQVFTDDDTAADFIQCPLPQASQAYLIPTGCTGVQVLLPPAACACPPRHAAQNHIVRSSCTGTQVLPLHPLPSCCSRCVTKQVCNRW